MLIKIQIIKNTFYQKNIIISKIKINQYILFIQLTSIFAYYDTDNSGFINKNEFENIIKTISLTEPISIETINKLFNEIDKDNSNSISFDEFILLFNNILDN